jgi:hypothetical protein
VLVEVKHRDWQGELTEEETRAGRSKQPKQIQGEMRVVLPWKIVGSAAEKAYMTKLQVSWL